MADAFGKMVQCPLAVFLPLIGVRSETFIRRHAQDLLPRQTATVAGQRQAGAQLAWDVAAPCLLAGAADTQRSRRWIARIRHGIRAGRPARDREVVAFLRRHRVQVVLSEYLDWSVGWIPAARRAGARFFAHAHGYDVSVRLREAHWQQRYAELREADGIITMSQYSRGRLLDLGVGLDAGKIHIVPYGVDVPAMPPRRDVRSGEVRCIAVGRMVAKKAPILLLDAFRRAAERVPELRLDYLGAGALLGTVRQYVAAMDLQHRVRLHGAVSSDTVCQLMRDADIFLQHSMTDPETGDQEGLPVAILEAMAQGLPVIATRHAGIPEAVEADQSGYLVDEGDTKAMAAFIMQLAGDAGGRAALGHRGWERCAQLYTWQRERGELLRVMGLEAYAQGGQTRC